MACATMTHALLLSTPKCSVAPVNHGRTSRTSVRASHAAKDQKRIVTAHAHWLRPTSHEPEYCNYLSREDLEERNENILARIVNPEREDPNVSAASLICQAGVFIRFNVLLLPLKYIAYSLFTALQKPLYFCHKKYVLALSAIDASLSGASGTTFQGSGGKKARFSRTVAMQRLHGVRSLLDDFKLWYSFMTSRGTSGKTAAAKTA